MAYSCTHATMRAFHSCTHETLLIYHTLQGFLRSRVILKGGAASLHSERQQKPSVTYLSDRKTYLPKNPVAWRICRVAKLLALWINKCRPFEGLMNNPHKRNPKTVFFERYSSLFRYSTLSAWTKNDNSVFLK